MAVKQMTMSELSALRSGSKSNSATPSVNVSTGGAKVTKMTLADLNKLRTSNIESSKKAEEKVQNVISQFAKANNFTVSPRAMGGEIKAVPEIQDSKKKSTSELELTDTVSDYMPAATTMTRAEYERRRASNPDMPEFGSYDYFKTREESLRPKMTEIANDPDRAMSSLVSMAENYKNDNNWTSEQGPLNMSRDLYEKFSAQDAIIAEYEDIHNQLSKFEKNGVHYTKTGEIDAASGKAEADYISQRLMTINGAKRLTDDEMVLGYTEELDTEKQAEYDANKARAGESNIERSKAEAYSYYEKHKDNEYADNFGGRTAGNYRVGRTGIKTNTAGKVLFDNYSDDFEAVEVYEALTKRIQENNANTFTNKNKWEEGLAVISQYAPQGLDQLGLDLIGRGVGVVLGALGAPPGTGELVGNALSADYMYTQTAGASYIRMLRDNGLSAEEAHKIAADEALLSSVVEFGLGWLSDGLWKNAGKAVKGAASETVQTITKKLVSAGLSENAVKTVINVVKNFTKLQLDSLGEGLEEFIQEGLSITADRFAKEGKTANKLELAMAALNFSNYTEEDRDRMTQAFWSGYLISEFGSSVRGASTYISNKVAESTNNLDTKKLGADIISKNNPDIVNAIIEIGLSSKSTEIKEIAEKVKNDIESGTTPDSNNVGLLTKHAFSEAFAEETQSVETNVNTNNVDTEHNDTPGKKGEKLENSNIVLEQDEMSYPYNQQEVIDGYEDAVDEDIIDFANSIRTMKNQNNASKRSLIVASISERFNNDVRQLTGTNFNGISHILRGSTISHIDERHGENGKADHSMANDNDLARIGWVLENYDNIELAYDKNGNQDFDRENQNSDQSPSPIVKVSKKINGTYFIVEAVPVSSANSAFIKSAYISKNSTEEPSAQLLKNMPDQSPQLTSEPPVEYNESASRDTQTRWPAHDTDNSIPQTIGSVKGANVGERLIDKNAPVDEASTDTDVDKTMFNIMDELGLTYDEQHAILEYKGAASYSLNYALRNGNQLSAYEQAIKDGVNSALDKFPIYQGVVYRNLGFDTKEELYAFIEQHKGNKVVYTAFTSASKTKDGYPVNMPYIVHCEIISHSARDVSDLGITSENEVLYKSGTSFELTGIALEENTVVIKLKETNYGERGSEQRMEKTGESDQVQENDRSKEFPGKLGKLSDRSSVIRSGSSTYDEVYDGTSDSNQGRIAGRSEQIHLGSDETLRNDGVGKGQALSTLLTENESIETLDIRTLESTPKSNFGKITPAQISALRKISRALGVNIILENGAEGYDGYYDASTRTIHINANSVKPIDTVVRHEIIHFMKREAPKEFLVFRDFIKQKYVEQYGQAALDEYVQNKKNQYKQTANKDISDDVAYEELCADIGMDMLSTASHVREFVIKHRNPARKLYEYTKCVIHTLGRVFGIDNIDNYSVYEAYIELAKATSADPSIEVDERAIVQRTYDVGFTEDTDALFASLPGGLSLKNFAEGSRLLGLALDSLENAGRKTQGKLRDIANSHMTLDEKKTAHFNELDNNLKAEMDEREGKEFSFQTADNTIDSSATEDIFSVSDETVQNFSEQIDRWLSGKMKSSDIFEVGNTPEVLKALGAGNLPVVMSQDVMAKITGEKHSIALDEIKQLPYAIADPIMVFKSATVDNAYVILTELIDKAGNDVVVAMHLNRTEKHIKVNRVSSIYGKYNIDNFVIAQIKNGNLKYVDKNKSLLWSQSRGLQLPKLADTTRGSTDSILQKEDIVNRYYAQNAKKYANDSKENDTLFSFSKVDNTIDPQYNVSDDRSAENDIENDICVIPEQTIVFSGSYRSLTRNKTFKTLFEAAKDGDVVSAKKLAKLFITDNFINKFNSKYKDVTIIPVIGKNDTTNNVIPQYVAKHVAKMTGNNYFDGIHKISKNNHKKKSSAARLVSKIDFAFKKSRSKDIEGRHFVIFDDCITTGTTATALRDFIEEHGGIVDGFSSLAKGIDSSDNMAITEEQFDELLNLTGEERKRELSRLTARQARTLINNKKTRNKLYGDDKVESQNDSATDSSERVYSFSDGYIPAEEASSDIDTGADLQYNVSNDITLFESKGDTYGYEQESPSGELGRIYDNRKNERSAKVDEVGHSQSQKTNTPHTKRIHRSGVSAEVVTSSGLTAEQAAIKAQNELEGYNTEFFINAKEGDVSKTIAFNTDNSAYYPDSHFERLDITITNGIAAFTEKRFNDLIEEFSVPVGGQLNGDYAKGYVAYISPSDFLSLTAVDEQRIIKDTKTNKKYGSGKLDLDTLSSNMQTPYLTIDFDNGKVTDHEGRHRMVMLRDAGINKVAIVIKDINSENGKYRTKKKTNVSVTGQTFNNGTAPGKVTINEIIPLSPNYRSEVTEKFVDTSSDIHYSFSDGYNLPSRDDSGNHVSRSVRTILESDATPDTFVPGVLREIREGRFSYETISDKNAEKRAKQYIKERGYVDVLKNIIAQSERGSMLDKYEIAILQTLLNQSAEHVEFLSTTDRDGVIYIDKLLGALVSSSRTAGQNLQAQKLIKKMSPLGMNLDIKRLVDDLNREIDTQLGDFVEEKNKRIIDSKQGAKSADTSHRYHKRQKPLVINADLQKQLLEAKTIDDAMKIRDKILEDLGSQVLGTVTDKLRAFRYWAMLSNPRTHVRNMVGNGVNAMQIEMSNVAAAVMQKVFIRDPRLRTKTIIGLSGKRRGDYNDMRLYAGGLFEKYIDFVRGESNRYDEPTVNAFERGRHSFNSKAGKFFEKIGPEFNSQMLEREDMLFLKGRFIREFANAAIARGYKLSDIESGKVSQSEIEALIELSAKQAQEATFREASWLATKLNELEKKNALSGLLVGAVVPFKKTPINILKTGMSYSPFGIISFCGKLAGQTYQKATGKRTSFDTVDLISTASKGLVGTGWFLLGAFLSSLGLLSGGDEDDDELQALKEARGEQNYAITVGDYTLTLDWLTPVNMPLFAGVAFMESLSEDGVGFGDIIPVLSDTINPVLEASMLSGVLDVLDSLSNAESDSERVASLMMSVISSRALQYFPSILAATARTIDEVESRTSVSDPGDQQAFERIFRQAVNKLPILRSLINKPYTDRFGGYNEKRSAGEYLSSLLQNFIIPGYISTVSDTETTEHLMDIYDETGRTDAIPSYVKYFTVNGATRRLTHDELYEYQVRRGELWEEVVSRLMKSKNYTSLDSQTQAELMSKLRELIEKICKYETDSGYNITNKSERAIAEGGGKVEDVLAWLAAKLQAMG